MSSPEVASAAEIPPVAAEATTDAASRPRSLTADAWYDLRRNPIFWFGVVIVLALTVVALFPGLFTSYNPQYCDLKFHFKGPGPKAPFGYDNQGCNVYARTIYGARSSISVGVLATLIAGAVAILLGTVAGYYGRWTDAMLSRGLDIIASIPLLLASIVMLKRLNAGGQATGVWSVAVTLGILGWPQAARVIRSSVISVKQQDFVSAARMLGAGDRRIMIRHILPNAIAPAIVVLTIALGSFIATEATLSFLGVGLQPPTISWGGSISENSTFVRTSAAPLLWPSGFLAVTVLAFIMLGDAIRDAFDPRMR